jgi:hypothetical protein
MATNFSFSQSLITSSSCCHRLRAISALLNDRTSARAQMRPKRSHKQRDMMAHDDAFADFDAMNSPVHIDGGRNLGLTCFISFRRFSSETDIR